MQLFVTENVRKLIDYRFQRLKSKPLHLFIFFKYRAYFFFDKFSIIKIWPAFEKFNLNQINLVFNLT